MQRSVVRRILPVLLLLCTTLIVGANAQQEPADVPSKWKGLIGEYASDRDTLCILEDHGKLRVGTLWGKKQDLQQESGGAFRTITSGTRCAFSRSADGVASTMLQEGKSYHRILTGPGEGRSFRITPLKPVEVLRREALKAIPPKEPGRRAKPDLVDVGRLDSTIRLDIRYATTENFIGAQFYSQARAFLQRPAAEALLRVHRALRPLGYGLLIHDAYRPWYVTKMFWDATPESQKQFVADPQKGSRHNRGCAVDLSLYDRTTGRPVEMTSGYDEFSHRAYPNYPGGTSLQRWYRSLLSRAMEAEGFKVFAWEWWHFDYKDWNDYPLGTATFEEIR